MKVLCALVVLFVAAEAIYDDVALEEWNLWKATYNKSYTTDEEDKHRFSVFLDNKHKIAKHNTRYINGLVSYKQAMNQFGDMLHHEFISTMTGVKRLEQMNIDEMDNWEKATTFIEPENVEFPKTVDWRTKGAVTPVKAQLHCGSCWAFSTTGVLEGQHFRKTGKLVSLSEQNLVDCSSVYKYGNKGCRGGHPYAALVYVKNNGGIDTEQAYPYENMQDQCHYKYDQSGATVSGLVILPEGDEQTLMKAVATVGPISVLIDANHPSFWRYSEGVYYEPECSTTVLDLDHAVLVVGYGTDDSGKDYWLVKNSWGESWGDKGYIKMSRNRDNNCGIATFSTFPLV